jgi:hypothetical protein
MFTEEELKIIRGINFSTQCLDKIKKMAIDEVKTIGEVYIMLRRRNFDGFFDRIDDGKELKNTDRSV